MTSTFRSILKSVLFLLAVIFVLINPAICAEQVFYSIHIATLKDLRDANKQVNSLKEKGKMVFWEKYEVPDIGHFYRVYVGRYIDWNDAAAYRDKLIKAGAVGHLGIQWFSEIVVPKEEQELPKLLVSKKPAIVHPLYSAPEKDRFVDNKDGTVTDTKTNLMWIKNGWRAEFISVESWFDAIDKCKRFSHGNYTDWRLPTLEEWNSLIDKNNQNPALVEPNPFVNMISHLPYWTQTEFSYSKSTYSQSRSLDTYTVLLYSGAIHHQKKTQRAFILPVRAIVAQKVHK
ncbi:DUF1566 domain-containing protein [Thermodesulfobacteriota bacterium]